MSQAIEAASPPRSEVARRVELISSISGRSSRREARETIGEALGVELPESPVRDDGVVEESTVEAAELGRRVALDWAGSPDDWAGLPDPEGR